MGWKEKVKKHENENNEDGSSSEEEDGDEQWKAAINDAVSSLPPSKPPPGTVSAADDDGDKPLHTHIPKHYQIKAQKTLDDLLDKSLLMVKETDPVRAFSNDAKANEGGVRLFKHAPVGIVFDHRDEPKGPRKKPRILPGEEIEENSKKFKKRMEAVVVEGMNILASAKNARQKSLAKFEAKQAAARDATKREEERVAQLKKIRGERWLRTMAREMFSIPQGQGHFTLSK